MSTDTVDNSENICVVCFKNVVFYSVGNCDHMVCYECSTRMRVLCRQNECPICRQDLPKVIFSKSLKPFCEMAYTAPYEDKKYKIQFQNRIIQDAFYKLLEHCCHICPNRQFKIFQQLYDHMKREHDLYYCDLCVENLKIFTSERRCYNKSDLAQHMRKGDPDDRSHRGHPLCEFCQVRYMDNDFLYRHLRKDHLFCHFCDADGHDLYYSSYDYLRDHFREEHYLCEEGACIEEKFTPVFRTEIDLKAHRVTAHGRTMGKAAAQQARTLELEFTLKPRPRQESSRKGKPQHVDCGIAVEGAAGITEERQPRMHSPSLDPNDFPSLPSGSGTVTVSSTSQRRPGALTVQAIGRKNAPLAMTDENFPVLGEYNDITQGTSVRLNINQDRSNNFSQRASVVAPRNVSIHVNHRQNGEQNIRIRQDEFPALSTNSGAQSLPAAKWVSVAHKKTVNPTPKQEKLEKKPLTDPDFPGLNTKFNLNLNLKSNEPPKANYVSIRSSKDSKNTKKSSSVVIPVRDDWLDTPEGCTSSLKSKTKKKKSKGNTNEERSDTAKKKDDKDAKSSVKGNSDITKSKSSAFEESSSGTKLVKPLPTAEDWFESSKKQQVKSVKEGDGEAAVGYSSGSNNEVSSKGKSGKIKSTKVNKIAEVNSSSSKDNSSACKQESKVPPGFDHLNGIRKSKEISKPPPGFTFDFPPSNGLTFTNSSGQNFIIPTNYNYTPPLNFEKRNQNLVTKVFRILLNETNLDQFKRMSALFRQDMLSAEDYCNHCIKTMGEDGFREIFPELLILLPDINKQQELFQVFSNYPKFDKEKTLLQSCDTCRQVLCRDDLKEHAAQHTLHENFPLLMPNAWAK